MRNKVRLGIIGYGNMGSTYFGMILQGKCPELEVTAFAEQSEAKLAVMREARREAAARTPGIPEVAEFSDAETMFRSGLIDAAIVCTPHYTHPELVTGGLRAGIHMLSEKPAGVYTLQVRDMIAEADKHKELVFGIMLVQRTNPLYRKMKEIISGGTVGNIRRVSWIATDWYRSQCYYDSSSWRATWSAEGGGVLLNQCPHNFDILQWLCGMPCSVLAKLHYGKWHDIEVEDDVSAYLEFPSGATGTFVTSTGDTPGTDRLEIVCDGGTLLCDGKTLTLSRLSVHEPEFSRINTDFFKSPDCEKSVIGCPGENTAHAGILNSFASAILHGTELIVDGREGLNGLLISNAMYLSGWLGREVGIPFDEELFFGKLSEKVAASKCKPGKDSVIADMSHLASKHGKGV